MTLQVGPVIGTVGGGIEATAVTGASQGGDGRKTIFTVPVPDGETWLVMGRGDLSISSTPYTYLWVGDERSGSVRNETAVVYAATVVAGPATVNVQIEINGSVSSYQAAFDGMVYAGRVDG